MLNFRCSATGPRNHGKWHGGAVAQGRTAAGDSKLRRRSGLQQCLVGVFPDSASESAISARGADESLLQARRLAMPRLLPRLAYSRLVLRMTRAYSVVNPELTHRSVETHCAHLGSHGSAHFTTATARHCCRTVIINTDSVYESCYRTRLVDRFAAATSRAMVLTITMTMIIRIRRAFLEASDYERTASAGCVPSTHMENSLIAVDSFHTDSMAVQPVDNTDCLACPKKGLERRRSHRLREDFTSTSTRLSPRNTAIAFTAHLHLTRRHAATFHSHHPLGIRPASSPLRRSLLHSPSLLLVLHTLAALCFTRQHHIPHI